jgi:hypothetical protein
MHATAARPPTAHAMVAKPPRWPPRAAAGAAATRPVRAARNTTVVIRIASSFHRSIVTVMEQPRWQNAGVAIHNFARWVVQGIGRILIEQPRVVAADPLYSPGRGLCCVACTAS